VATSLLGDALGWLRRHRAERVFVNTHVANDPALGLYRAHGFHDLPERLRVFEGPTQR
jgi:ribosomal protein S18 acetylase RimI-like enzyme